MVQFSFVDYQKKILNLMGIQQWAGRQDEIQLVNYNVWREDLSESKQPVEVQVLEPKPNLIREQKFEDLPIEKKTHDVEPITPKVSKENPQNVMEQIHLQALVTQHYALIVNVSPKQPDQWQLWQNMKNAFQQLHFRVMQQPAEEYQLDGQLSFLRSVEPKSAVYYIQGFLQSIVQQQKMIILGDMPILDIQQIPCERYASLVELKESQELKKEVWQRIQHFYQ